MGHTTTTTTISVPLEVGYVCSKCGTANLQTSIVKEWADSFRHGTIHTKSTYEKMSEESREGAEYRIGRRIDKIVDEAEINRFRKAELKCKCEKCKHTEPWAKMRFTRFEGIIAWFMVMLVPIAGFAFLGGEIATGILLLLCSAAIAICWSMFKKIVYNILEKEIETLPKKSLPTMFLQVGDKMIILNQKLENEKKMEEETEKKIIPNEEHTATISQDTIFCRKCGSKILNDSVFCAKCGTKVEQI